MFTGLVDDVGRIDAISVTEAGRELRVACRYGDLASGESVALNGVCLTVRECGSGWFTAAAIESTLSRTTIGRWTVGTQVNLERALVAGARLGGHVVQGHVDGIAVVQVVNRVGDMVLIELALAPSLAEVSVLHGSIAVDGVSLTINGLPSGDVVQLALIDFTIRHTTLGSLGAGDAVNVETDIMGKYVRQLLGPYLSLQDGRSTDIPTR